MSDQPPKDPDRIIAEAQVAAKRMARQRNLILGILLIAIGAVIVIARVLLGQGYTDVGWKMYGAGAVTVIAGIVQTARGIANKPDDGDPLEGPF